MAPNAPPPLTRFSYDQRSLPPFPEGRRVGPRRWQQVRLRDHRRTADEGVWICRGQQRKRVFSTATCLHRRRAFSSSLNKKKSHAPGTAQRFCSLNTRQAHARRLSISATGNGRVVATRGTYSRPSCSPCAFNVATGRAVHHRVPGVCLAAPLRRPLRSRVRHAHPGFAFPDAGAGALATNPNLR